MLLGELWLLEFQSWALLRLSNLLKVRVYLTILGSSYLISFVGFVSKGIEKLPPTCWLIKCRFAKFWFLNFVGMERLPFKPEGYNFWTWRGHKIHYVVQGEGPAIVLIHGFGASVFHWRSDLFAFFCLHFVIVH